MNHNVRRLVLVGHSDCLVGLVCHNVLFGREITIPTLLSEHLFLQNLTAKERERKTRQRVVEITFDG